MAAPMPRLPPVTNAHLCWSVRFMSFLLGLGHVRLLCAASPWARLCCRVRSGRWVLRTAAHRGSWVEACQPCTVIGDEDRKQACRLRGAGILTDEMRTAGRLEEALAGLVDLDRPGRGALRANRAREHVGE